MNRRECLEQAIDLVTRDREATHGPAAVSFEMHSVSWTQAAGVEIEAWKVALMQAQFKINRILNGDDEHVDHFVDIAGYMSISVELRTEPQETEAKDGGQV
jgi:hypothetical protein